MGPCVTHAGNSVLLPLAQLWTHANTAPLASTGLLQAPTAASGPSHGGNNTKQLLQTRNSSPDCTMAGPRVAPWTPLPSSGAFSWTSPPCPILVQLPDSSRIQEATLLFTKAQRILFGEILPKCISLGCQIFLQTWEVP